MNKYEMTGKELVSEIEDMINNCDSENLEYIYNAIMGNKKARLIDDSQDIFEVSEE